MLSFFEKKSRPYRWLRWMLKHKHWTVDEMYNGTLRFSQFGEEAILDTIFSEQKQGIYVDCGAFHPIRGSNSYSYYKKGWRGINIEPNPEQIAEFRRLRPSDINLNLAVAAAPGIVPFCCDGVYSGIAGDNRVACGGKADAKIVEVEARPLSDILAQYLTATTIDFLSIDCEGHDLIVLESNDWKIFRPRVILVEDHTGDPNGNITTYLSSLGYVYYCRTTLTNFYLREDTAKAFLPDSRLS